MSDSSSRVDSSHSAQYSREHEPGKTQGPSDALVQDNDMVEIAMSLRHICDVLENSGSKLSTTGSAAAESDFWLDDDYVYLDVVYPESDELRMDICVHRGRAFIRVERERLGMGLVEIPV
jgi:hypothetical protein